jgi:hypothetical protein
MNNFSFTPFETEDIESVSRSNFRLGNRKSLSVSPTAGLSPFEAENFLETAFEKLIESTNIEFEGDNLDIEVNFTVGEWNETKGIKNEVEVGVSNRS